MYNNVGGKIKALAMGICIIEAVALVITGFVLMEEIGGTAILIVLLGPVVAWLSSLVLYAFGELVEDVHALRNKEGTTEEAKAKRNAEEKAKRKAEEKARLQAAQAAWMENAEGAEDEQEEYVDVFCPKCGEQLSFTKDKTVGTCPMCDTKFQIK